VNFDLPFLQHVQCTQNACILMYFGCDSDSHISAGTATQRPVSPLS